MWRSQIQAAECLRVIYDSLGEGEKSDVCVRFLANHKKSEGENKALTSKLEDLFKTYTSQKQEKQAEAERKIAEKRVMNTVIPIAIAVALTIFCVLIWRNRRQLKFQQKEADRALGEAEQEHEKELLHGRHITTRDTSFKHEAIALKEEDYKQLKEAVERHYAGFDNALLSRCPSLRHSDLALCHLHLMGLGEGEIAALRRRTYSGIKKQNESLQEKLGVKEDIASYIMRVIEGLCGTQNGTQTNGVIDDDLDAWIERQIKDNPKITTEELAEKSHKGVRTIKRHISMTRHIRYVGSGYSGHWEVIR